MFNPLSPNIHIQILQTDLHIFPLRISWENLIKDQGIFALVIILLTLIVTLITFSLANLWISSGENWCWSLLGLKGLNNSYIAIECDNNCLDGMYYLGVIQLNLVFIMFSFCATWMNQVQCFRHPKLLTSKKSLLSILFWNLQFTRTNERYRFF